MFRLDRLTQKAQEALQQAQGVAEKNQSQMMFPLHLLIALAEEKEGVVRPVLEKCGVRPDAILSEAQRLVTTLPKTGPMQPGMFLTRNRGRRPPSQWTPSFWCFSQQFVCPRMQA